MKSWENRFLKYCLQEGLLSQEQVRQITRLREKISDKNTLILVSEEMGWNKKQAREYLSKACPDRKTDEFPKSGETEKAGHRDLSIGFASELARMHEEIKDEQVGEEESKKKASKKTAREPISEQAPEGEKLGPYILVEKIGAGGMGVVYKAYHPKLDQYFAVKTILPGQVGEEQIKRFIREARVAAKLRHPNIVAVHDVGEDAERYYIAMDYINGRDLGSIIKTEKLSPRDCLELIKDIAQALDMAHSQKIIHRDIKPSNILVAEDEHPYLMDFGLASVVQQSSGITRSGQVLGTPQYMSPEQAKGKARDLDARSDIYSLGAVLYEMLTGNPVVNGGTVMQALYQVVYVEPVPISKHGRMIAQDVEAITMKCLEKEPRARYQSITELAQDIHRYLRGEPVMARPAGFLYRLSKWVKRNKAMSIVIIMATLIILGTTSVFIAVLFHRMNLEQVARRAAEEAGRAAEEARRAAEKERDRATGAMKDAEKAKKLAEERLLALQIEKKRADEAVEDESKLRTAQRIIDEAIRWAEENRSLDQIDEKLTQAEKETCKYAGLYRAWGKIYYDYGIKEKGQERLKQGLDKLEKATILDKDDYLAWFYQYLIYDHLGDKNKANGCIWQILRIDPQNEYGFFGRGIKFHKESQKTRDIQEKNSLRDKALASYSKAIEYKQDFAWSYSNRGLLYKDMKRYSEALNDYEKALSINPDLAEAYCNRGTLYKEVKRYSEALNDYEKALSINPDSFKTYSNRGLLYKDMKRYSEALNDYTKALSINPDLDEAYRNRGNIYRDMNQYSEALNDYTKALSINPDLAGAYNNRGALYEHMKRYSEALNDYDKALSINPDLAEACRNRGNIYKDMERYSEALNDYTKAVKINSHFWQAYANRGILYFTLRQYSQAVEDLEQCKRLGVKDPLIDQHLQLSRQALEQQK